MWSHDAYEEAVSVAETVRNSDLDWTNVRLTMDASAISASLDGGRSEGKVKGIKEASVFEPFLYKIAIIPFLSKPLNSPLTEAFHFSFCEAYAV